MKNEKLFKKENLNLIAAIGIAAIAIIILLSTSGCVGPSTPGNETNATPTEPTGETFTSDNVAKIKLTTGDGKASEDYVLVGSGKYSFENEIIGMAAGDNKTVTESKQVAVKLIHEPKEGMVYMTQIGEQKVFNVTDTEFIIGHKLAGETLNFNIIIKSMGDVAGLRKTCLSKYNLSADTIAFLHSNSCPHCIRMKPFVTTLENESYKFLWVEGSDTEKVNIAKECFADVLNFNRGVPQFGCPSNGKLQLGAFTGGIEDMKKFADECRKAAGEMKEETGTEKVVKSGDSIEVGYVGKLTNGEIFDEGTLEFVVGAGQMIAGFDEAVVGMKINESKDVTIPPEKAYGYPEQTIPREFPQDIPIDQFKQAFNEEPVLNKEYLNPQVVPWPIKVVEIKTEENEYTIEILDVLTKEEFSDVMAKKKPEVEVFVMSYCPYGTQIEKGIIPVQELLGDKANIHIRFVHYLMHGKKEADENTLQYCIDKEQKDKFWPYLACFLEKGDSPGCITKLGIDNNKLQTCIAAADKEFGISTDLASGAQYPPYKVHAELSNQYGVGGSPTLIIEGNKVQVNRDSESLKNAICDAFMVKPPECEQTLSDAAPSPGFGFTGGGGGSAGSCG